MTCLEKLKIEHPEKVDSTQWGGATGCPDNYGYLPKPEFCRVNESCCERCWNREIIESSESCESLYNEYSAFIKAGFTREQAFTLVFEKFKHDLSKDLY